MTGATLEQLAERLKSARRVAISAHIHPDGDAIGSVLALAEALRGLGIQADPLLADEEEQVRFNYLPGYGSLTHASEYAAKPDLFVALDTPNPARLGDSRAVMEAAPYALALDHHPDLQPYADLWTCASEAAAVGEVLWDLLGILGRQTSETAACCYTALITDTGRFQYQNTTAHTFAVASELVSAGANPSCLSDLVFQNESLGTTQLEARVASRIKLEDGGRIAVSWTCDADYEELSVNRGETETLPDVLRRLRGVEYLCLLRQQGTSVRGSMRAKGTGSVRSAATALGGGGHDAAAGFLIENTTVEDVYRRVVPLLKACEQAGDLG